MDSATPKDGFGADSRQTRKFFFLFFFNPNSSPVSEVDGWKTEDYNFPHLFSEVASKASAL